MKRKIPFKRMLERMPTEQLDEILQAELQADNPDDDAVRMILAVLRDREKDTTVEITAEMQEAWKDYQRDKPVRRVVSPGLLRAAAACIIVVFGIAIIPYANAEVAEYFTRWTDSVYEFIVPGAIRNEKEFVFETDHAGLQEIYDTAVSLGIEKPTVPTWLPGETVLTECRISETSQGRKITSSFSDNIYDIAFTITLFSDIPPHEYQKNKNDSKSYEVNGRWHTIQKNHEMWIVFWINSNVEYFFTINCSESDLYSIIDSAYI